MATKQTIKQEIKPFGMVAYTDGGCRPNPGYGGWGMHAYIYSDSIPKKGSGNTKNILTQNGYVEKTNNKDVSVEKDEKKRLDDLLNINNTSSIQVSPMHYLDGYGSFGYQVTNNVGEVVSAANALIIADEYDIKKLTIITDSEHVIKGATDWLSIWKKNNWIKRDGSPVSNKYYWTVVDDALTKLKNKGVHIEFKWVKGHREHLSNIGNNLGNAIADRYATLGVLRSKGQNEDKKLARNEEEVFISPGNRNEIIKSNADGYWSTVVEKNPFISHRSIYFSTKEESNVPGEYFLGDHGRDDELLGKRTPDGTYSYVKLANPEIVIEEMRKKQIEYAFGLNVIVMGKLDKLYEANTYKTLMTFGNTCLYTPYSNKLDMYFIDEEPVTKELRPPRLAMRAIDAVNTLKGLLLSWQSSENESIQETDVTSLFYERNDKNVMCLKEEYIVGFTSVSTDVLYGAKVKTDSIKIDLCLGVDIPNRNCLKKLEKFNPTMIVITWMESDKMFRYATIIRTKEDIGIWAGMYSNMRVVP